MICNTRLSLSLASSTAPHDAPSHQNYNNRESTHDDHHQELDTINPIPSLNLCLSTSSEFTNCNMNPQVNSSVSSFSNTSVKRERDPSLEEEVQLETNKVKIISPKALVDDQDHDEDVHEYGTRKKLRLSKEQSDVLEDSFKEHTTLNSKQKRDLARRLSLRPRQVEVWFQNRRARTKLKQTEVDCEILRKCYEDLKDENGRLKKELQELKSMKMSAPFRVQLSAATLSMCPSCEKTYGGAGDNSTKISFSMGDQKPQFYGSFTNPSAALLS
ncbi:homeobox-leucine zipper protein HAT22-like [Lycium barbarum]|uniref:homeobox-leucine zipper protein HAT22-like n=1 Tax=Lycium barbarum TaxID=112863 RepID=UPI00293F3A34|nr:homeobox-leucine zipper protein HAT22-like [Lycium barbarum]